MGLAALSPNQFALPGMEDQAHPLARHVAAGVEFRMRSGVQNVAKAETPDTLSGFSASAYRPPQSFDPEATEHTLSAQEGNEELGTLSWHGDAPSRIHRPGEVTWVERTQGSPAVADALRAAGRPVTDVRRHGGLMGDMFHAGHQIGMGQRTLPVHSSDRTGYGQAWANRVGPPELVPKLGGNPVETPPGFHPFERAGAPRQTAPAMEGQRSLSGIGGHVLKEQRRVDVLRAQRDRPYRAVAEATFHNGVRVR